VSFTCPRCGRISHHPADEAEQYCGACHDFTGTRQPLPGPYLAVIMARLLKRCHPDVYVSVLSAARQEDASSMAGLRAMRGKPGWGS